MREKPFKTASSTVSRKPDGRIPIRPQVSTKKSSFWVRSEAALARKNAL